MEIMIDGCAEDASPNGSLRGYASASQPAKSPIKTRLKTAPIWSSFKSCLRNILSLNKSRFSRKASRRAPCESSNEMRLHDDFTDLLLLHQGYGMAKSLERKAHADETGRDTSSGHFNGSIKGMATGSSTTLHSYSSQQSLNQANLDEWPDEPLRAADELLPDTFQADGGYQYFAGFEDAYDGFDFAESSTLYHDYSNTGSCSLLDVGGATPYRVSPSNIGGEQLACIVEEPSVSAFPETGDVAVPVPLSLVRNQPLRRQHMAPAPSPQSPSCITEVPVDSFDSHLRSASPVGSFNSSLLPVPIELSNSVESNGPAVFAQVHAEYTIESSYVFFELE